MSKVIFRLADGTDIGVDAFPDMSVMEAALMGDVPNILGMCGGIKSCATCHVVIDDAWRSKVTDDISQEEADMLDGLDGRQAGSRLGCQVKLGPACDGLVVHVPAST